MGKACDFLGIINAIAVIIHLRAVRNGITIRIDTRSEQPILIFRHLAFCTVTVNATAFQIIRNTIVIAVLIEEIINTIVIGIRWCSAGIHHEPLQTVGNRIVIAVEIMAIHRAILISVDIATIVFIRNAILILIIAIAGNTAAGHTFSLVACAILAISQARTAIIPLNKTLQTNVILTIIAILTGMARTTCLTAAYGYRAYRLNAFTCRAIRIRTAACSRRPRFDTFFIDANLTARTFIVLAAFARRSIVESAYIVNADTGTGILTGTCSITPTTARIRTASQQQARSSHHQ